MALTVHPEIGVPYTDDTPYMDLRERAEAACNTAISLEEHGLELTPTKEDKEVATKLAMAYAKDPEKTSKKVPLRRLRPSPLPL